MIQPYVTLSERGVLSVAISGDFQHQLYEGRAAKFGSYGWPSDAPKKPKGWDDAVASAREECEKRLEDDHEAIMATCYGRKFD